MTSLRTALTLSTAALLIAFGSGVRGSPHPPQVAAAHDRAGEPPATDSSSAARPSKLSADLIAKRVQPCTLCHSERGRATAQGYFPRIAGKPAGYLFNQLVNFRSGRRHFPTMVYFTQLQDDASLRQMADYFAAQQLPYPHPESLNVDPQMLARGHALARQGDRNRDLPACAACHGERLLGVQPAVPGLLGVSQDYLLGQLGGWRNDTRSAAQPDCMARIAQRLSPADLAAVTAWLASQPVPPGAQPADDFTQPPPLRCGSIDGTPRPDGAVSNATATPGAAAGGSTGAAADVLPAQLLRGRQLLRLGNCEACHTSAGGAPFAGGRSIPTRFGTFYAPNITPDPRTGIGGWSEPDFWRALHEGEAPDGTPLYPAFPYPSFTQLTRRDVDAMYAYLRSVTPMVQPNHPQQLRFPYRYRVLLAAWRALYFRAGSYLPDPQRSAQWNRGAYLVQGLAHCSACHGTRNALGALRPLQQLSGDQILSWYAPSLLDPAQAGVQNWSQSAIVTLLQTGVIGLDSPAAAHAVTSGPMAEVVFDSLQYAAAQDLAAIAQYLQSLPAPSAPAPSVNRASDQVMFEGGQIYRRHCASCHGAQGRGLAPIGPALAGNRAVTMPSVIDPIRLILFGGYAPGTGQDPTPFGMPPFSEQLSDAQIAQVLTYVRQSWGNGGAQVDTGAIGPNRGSPLW